MSDISANPNSLFGHVLRNIVIFSQFKRLGFDYIVNPETGELHKAAGGELSGAHNLRTADLGNFIGLTNLDSVPAHLSFDGTVFPFYDVVTGEPIGEYVLNKCKHCYPDLL